MSIQQEIESLKKRIAALQRELADLEACVEDEEEEEEEEA